MNEFVDIIVIYIVFRAILAFLGACSNSSY